MSAHCSVQQLSSYVDEELTHPELRLVESHLSDCPECRDRLAGLGNVVRELRRVERAAPPPELGYRVERAVDHAAGPMRLWQRGEAGARRWLDPPTVAPIFGVVLALAVIFYLAAVYNAAGTATRLVIAPGADESESEEAAEGVARDLPGGAEVVQWAGRTFRRHGQGWWEEGLSPRAPFRVLEFSELADALGSAEPLVLEPLSGPVRMRIGGEVIEVAFP